MAPNPPHLLVPVLPGLRRLRGQRFGGLGSLAEGSREERNTYRLTCLWAESKRLQNAKNSAFGFFPPEA